MVGFYALLRNKNFIIAELYCYIYKLNKKITFQQCMATQVHAERAHAQTVPTFRALFRAQSTGNRRH